MYNSPQPSGSPARVIVIVLGVVAVLCLCIAGLVGAIVYLSAATSSVATQISTQIAPQLTEAFQPPTATRKPPTATAVPQVVLTPVPTPVAGSQDTLQTLEEAIIPPSDLREEAMRLKNTGPIPEVVASQPATYQMGQEIKFNALNPDTQANFQVQAKLLYATTNAYFFAQDGRQVDMGRLKSMMDTFQNKIYPTDRSFFGSEWKPGVDDDPHLFILYVGGIGQQFAGYFSSADEYSHLANPYSNEHEMFYLNADNQQIGDPYLLTVLAHEFQHMIHWAHDRNEETWMNEGSSVLAEFLNGYDIGGFDFAYVNDTDLQLTGWSEDPSTDPHLDAHYGAGFLFMAYFLDRFGTDATKALIADQANGMQAVDDTLKTLGLKDKSTGQPITSNDLFADWTIANYLGDANVGDGRYAYHNYPAAPHVDTPTDTFATCPTQTSATVHEFGAVYYEIDCAGKHTISFTGSQQVQVIPTKPNSGRYAFWGHRNDESDTSMTREFDLTGLTKATLEYHTWYEIEKNWDYAYLEASTDGGNTWTIVKTPSGTDANPAGANFGWGYTGNSGGGDSGQWIDEKVDLTPFAGKKVQLRFEYITDTAVTWPGFMVDDISIPELKYSTDFETDNGGWTGNGFVRIDNILPQEFVVQVITQGAETTVRKMTLDAKNTGSLDINLQAGDKAIVEVSGLTPFTTEVASFQFSIN